MIRVGDEKLRKQVAAHPINIIIPACCLHFIIYHPISLFKTFFASFLLHLKAVLGIVHNRVHGQSLCGGKVGIAH